MPSVPGFVGTITAPGSTGQQTYTLPGGSGDVKALLLFWTEQTTDGSAAHARFCAGMGTYRGGSVQQFFSALSSQDAQAVSAGAREQGTDAICVLHDEGTTTRDGEIDLVSLGSEQFVLDWVNLPGTGSSLLSYVALCGSAFTDAMVNTVLIANATGAQDVTVTSGFGQPDLLLVLSSGASVVDASDPTADNVNLISICLGAGIKGGQTRATAWAEDDGNSTMNVGVWQQAGVVLTMDDATPSTEQGEADLAATVGWPTDGFELSRINAQLQTIGYLALKGTFNKALSARNTRTATGDDDYDVGFSNQKVALCWGTNVIASGGATSPNTTHAQLGQFWVGACDSLGNEVFKGISEEDGATDSDTYSYHSGTKTVQMHNADDGSLLLEADGSFSTTNFRLNYNDIDATSREYNALVIGWDAPAGGDDHTAEPADTLALADAMVKARGILAADTVALADARTHARGLARADTLALADAVATAKAVVAAVNDTLALTDARALGRGLSIADAVAVADALSRVAATARAVADSVVLADALDAAKSVALAINDTLTLADNVSRAKGATKALTDSVPLADTLETLKSLTAAIDDALALTDARTFAFQKAVADALAVADAFSRSTATARALADTVALSDNLATAKAIPLAVNDTVALSDSLASAKAIPKAIADTLTLTDAETEARGLLVADTLALADQFARTAAQLRTIQDTLAVADNVETEVDAGGQLAEDIDDSLALADALTMARAKALTDAVALTDALARAVASLRSVADTVALSDALSSAKAVAKAVADTVALTDSLTLALAHGLTIADTVALTDSATLVETAGEDFEFTVEDEIALTDLLTARHEFPVTACDTGHLARDLEGRIATIRAGRIGRAREGSLA